MLRSPTPSSAIVSRARVLRRLQEAAAYPVIFIVAPAGSGKSVALSQFCHGRGGVLVRFDMRSEHGQLFAFVDGLAGALSQTVPSVRPGFMDALISAQRDADPPQALAQWFAFHLRAFSGAIALDDAHHGEGDERIAAFLAALIDETAEHVHWMIASRVLLDLPLPRWIASGTAASPITERDLNFTPDEARDAAKAMGAVCGEKAIDRLLSLTSGWATGFSLALRLTERTPDFASAATLTRRLSYEYLAQHVYGGLEDAEQELLCFGALLPEYDVRALSDAGFAQAGALLDGLVARVTFLSIAPSEVDAPSPMRYRCHDLFRDFLLHQVELRGHGVARDWRIRAGSALCARGAILPALRLFIDADATSETLELLASHGFDLIERGSGDIVAEALARIDPRARASSALTLALRGQLESRAGRYEAGTRLLEQALTVCETSALRSVIALRLGIGSKDRSKAMQIIEEALRGEDIPQEVEGELLSILALLYAEVGDRDRLVAVLDQVERRAPLIDSGLVRGRMLRAASLAAIEAETDDARSKRLALEALQFAEEEKNDVLRARAFGVLVMHGLLFEDDLDAARRYAAQQAEAAERSREIYHVRGALLRSLEIEMRAGNRARVSEVLDALRALPFIDDRSVNAILQQAEGMLAAWNGKYMQAHALLAKASEAHLIREHRLLAGATAAVFAAAGGERDAAPRHIERTLAEITRGAPGRAPFARAAGVARLLCAVAERIQGRTAAASRLLQPGAETQGRSLQLVHRLIAALVRSGSLERAAVEDDLASLGVQGYRWYVELCCDAVERSMAASMPDLSLTPTELAVLRALDAGSSPKEIAIESSCSIYTVRAHIRAIIKKFGCTGREQALRAARAQGVLR